jgi:hypothetical protein
MAAKKSKEGRAITVTVNYGYDIHSVKITRAEYEQIYRGEATEVKGDGFSIEGEMDSDSWTFNKETPGSVYVTTDNLHDIYIGTMGDGNVMFDPHDLNSGPKYSAEGFAEAQAWQRHRRPNPNIRGLKKPKDK